MSAPLPLRVSIGNYPYVQPLKDGSVKSDRLKLTFIDVDPLNETFRRMIRDHEFDVSEMALTTHAMAHAFNKRLIGLPIILHRNFHHAALLCLKGSPLKNPADLAGRKVAVRAYSQTTGVWIRGVLETEYGLDIDSVTWITTEDAHVKEYQDPPNVVRAAPGKSLKSMLFDGEVDAAIGLRQADPAQVRTVIPDADQAAAAWYRKTGIYPANHAVSMWTDLAVEHPWLGAELSSLFVAAKAHARKTGLIKAVAYPATPQQLWLRDLVGDEPYPYGLDANRLPIETLVKFAARQKLIPRAYRIDELFDTNIAAAA
jgi:4,5-dihydroxyphthalate decarboxylase